MAAPFIAGPDEAWFNRIAVQYRRRATLALPIDHIDTFGILASAAAELKCAADVIYATHSIPEAMLDATLARLAEAMATVRAIKERTT